MEGDVVLSLNQVPSVNAVLRALKREESSLFNCVVSIVDDAMFVQQVAARYPSLPVLPNLRCGLWYVKPPLADSCYFKSTDGHNNNWSFSLIRLNLNVAEAAVRHGGCLIVDATRRGKRFPDAMSKTVPIWSAVLNRAVHRLRQQAAAAAAAAAAADAGARVGEGVAGPSAAEAEEALAAGPDAEGAVGHGAQGGWDCDVHLPPWVSDVEANTIRQRLDGWVDQLLEVRADLSALVSSLSKPLRCMWISQDSPTWLADGEHGDGTAGHLSRLPFTPILLVGASATNSRQRRLLTLPADGLHRQLSISYSYFPGAADDEESWGCGLTPPLMWRHLHALLAAGPGGIEPLVQQLLEQEKWGQKAQGQEEQHGSLAAEQQGVASSTTPLAGVSGGLGSRQQAAGAASLQPLTAAGVPPGAARLSAINGSDDLLQQGGEAGLHCLLPKGCLPAHTASVQRVGSGIYVLGSTGLAVSSASAAAAPAVWQHADAVLHLGMQPLPGFQQEPRQQVPSSSATTEEQPGQRDQQQQQAELQKQAATQQAATQQAGPAATAAAGAEPPALRRFCWLPVRSSKAERHALQEQLWPALHFAHAHLQRGRRLLLCCDTGLDASVCVATACLLAFYRLEEQAGSGSGLRPVWVGAGGGTSNTSSSERRGSFGEEASKEDELAGAVVPLPLAPAMGADGFSKLAVRQYLAAVTAHYPAARPTRGSLRQVFNFFFGQLTNS